MKLIPENTNIDFMGKAKFAIVLSVLMIAASIYIWMKTKKFEIS